VSRSDRIPIERRTIPNGHRATDAGAVRRGARLAGRGWLGQGFQQGPDLSVGVASVAAQGADVGQPALLGPAADRLWGHLEELGDLGGTQVPGLGWLGQRALPFLGSSPIGGRLYAGRGRMPSRVLPRRAILECVPMQLGCPAGHAWTLTSLSSPALERCSPPTQWLPHKQLACTAVVLLLGMPGRPVVTSRARSR
jgi:hypothetical protein